VTSVGTPRVLIVEDEPNIVLSLEILLRRAGYETASTGDGEEALELIRRTRPDVVLLDIMLPKRNGYEVCRSVKSEPSLSSIPVIMLTAKGQEVEILKGLELGASAYIAKPFGNAEVLEAVRAALEPRA
jgi:DNA-binding response OmpR family regulator